MKKLKKIIPVIIAFIIGISTTVTAATVFNSKDITYSSDKTTKTNVKDSLDELYKKVNTPWKCADGYYCYTQPVAISDQVKIGDYIRMTPISTSYTISKELTGYESDQTINPSELNLWLVLRKRDDGCIDLVSQYVTRNQISFKGKTGYTNYVNVLNRISNDAFIDGGLVEVGWSIGSHDTEQICKDPLNCHEDSIYMKDIDDIWYLTHDPRGTLPGTGDPMTFFLPSRMKDVRLGAYLFPFYRADSMEVGYATAFKDDGTESVAAASIRPMVRLKASVRINGGDGSRANPYLII